MARKQIKAFISYSDVDKKFGILIKNKLIEFGIKCFLAHEDLNVSVVFEKRIISELKKCDIFIPILSRNFRKSDWAQMELGSVIPRNILIIPLSLDETAPFGFIRHINGKKIDSSLSVVDLVQPILEHRKLSRHMLYSIIKKLRIASSFAEAESSMSLLAPYFKTLNRKDRCCLLDYCIENNQVWSADQCRELLKAFIKTCWKNSKNKKIVDLSMKIIGKRFYE